MINLNVGALRPAKDDARSSRVAAANDLVQRTLARHGLVPGSESGPHDSARPVLAPMNDLLKRVGATLATPKSADAPIAPGAEFRAAQYSCAAGSRAYRTYVPSTANEGLNGLVVMLHGCTQSPEDFALGTGMNALAERHRLVVMYPRQCRGENAQSCWNWFRRADQTRDQGEPAIIAGLTLEAVAEFGVSRDRTFVAGLSAGAAMAVILGETYPDVFAAVGAHSGLPFGAARDVPSAFAAMAGNPVEGLNGARGTTAIRTIIFQGNADATVHPLNSDRIARDAMDRAPRETVQHERRGTIAGREFVCSTMSTADGATQLEHWVIDGLGHAWSGGRPAGSYTDTSGPDASAEMIRFFLNADAKDT